MLAHGRATAASLGPDIAERIDWVEGDLAVWTPELGCYDLVTSLYVHVAGSVEEMVSRLATGVVPGGTLLLVGHLPIDPTTGAETPAAGQVQVTGRRGRCRPRPAALGNLHRGRPTENRRGRGLRRGDLRAPPGLTVLILSG